MHKDLRVQVYGKYLGHCAYCGREIGIKSFQVDHLIPKYHHRLSLIENDQLNDISNLMPSCAKCNSYKSAMTLEEFREELQKQISRLLKNPQFNRALQYKQIEITESRIEFYFERFV